MDRQKTTFWGPLAHFFGLWYDYNLFLDWQLFIKKPNMESSDLQKQLNLKQTELNYTHDADMRIKIEKAISILRLKLEIEKIKERISFLSKA